MLHDPAAVRAGFEEAANTFTTAVRGVSDDGWDTPGALGEWTARELTAHTIRAFTSIERYLDAEPEVDRVLADATEYYHTVLGDPEVHVGVLARGRQAALELSDPVSDAEAAATRVVGRVAATGDDEPLNTFAGQITMAEYLATRVVELGVHTLDLQRATGQHAELHPATASIVLAVLTQLGSATPVILALTGRAPLPVDFNLLS
ncbi:MAG TPA: maleylpyruvate isomerase N-terminal domain-containing protein [Ilumatobacteraceae bacterium]|nr:maleylpyruvate isomerase N-terminal domain-containing protein [Ilumatobacteraceae bacterium]